MTLSRVLASLLGLGICVAAPAQESTAPGTFGTTDDAQSRARGGELR